MLKKVFDEPTNWHRVSYALTMILGTFAVARAYIRRVVTVLRSPDVIVRKIAQCESKTSKQLVRTLQTVFRMIGFSVELSAVALYIGGISYIANIALGD